MLSRLVDHGPAEPLVLEERVVGDRHPEGERKPGREDQEGASPEREVDGVSASHRNGTDRSRKHLPASCNRRAESGIPGSGPHSGTSASRRFLRSDATMAAVRMAAITSNETVAGIL